MNWDLIQPAWQSQAMCWATQEARREPCNDPACSPVGALQWVKKILAAHQRPRNTLGTALTPCQFGSLQQTQR